MTSASVQSTNVAPESIESDYSIISESPLTNCEILKNGCSEVGNIDMPDWHSTLMSTTPATPDISIGELQSHLADVVQENVSLREALEKNKHMIQQQLHQLGAIMVWHDDLTTSMSQQQLTMKEGEEKIELLKKENTELQNKIVELQNKVLEMENKSKNVVDCAVSTGDGISPINDDEVDFEIVNRKDFKNKTEELENACSEITKLNKVVEEQKKQIEILITAQELKGTEDKPVKNSCIEQLEEKIKKFEEILTLKELELDEEKTSHAETKKMLVVVQTNYDRVTKLLQIQSKDERGKKFEDIEREMDTKMYLEKVDDVTAKLLVAEEKLEEKENALKSLTSELEAMKAETEIIPILRSQIDVYKMDLDSVTLAHEAAVEEASRLSEQVHRLASVSLCDSCGSNLSHVEGSSRGKRSGPQKKLEVKQSNNMFICPLCDISCTTLHALEKHANDCCDKHK